MSSCIFGLQRIKKNECVIVTCGLFCNIIVDFIELFFCKNSKMYIFTIIRIKMDADKCLTVVKERNLSYLK